jgi:isopenicillin N synthase-like dioxygenase
LPGATSCSTNTDQAFYTGDAAAKKQLVDDVRSCCLHNGFFQITGHQVPRDLQQGIMDWNKKFFDLSLEQKLEVSKGALSLPSHALLR